MRNFDTNVQELEYKVLREVARGAINGTLETDILSIPKTIVPGPKPTMRCCIYKERAIVEERIKMAMGGNPDNPNIVEVLPIACDECPLGGYEVTNRCRGCIAHRCANACHRSAISFDPKTRTAMIDKTQCVNCGLCAKACQYNAIQNFLRPCVQACKIKAISRGEDDAAKIDNEKCIQCGACVYQCPFGAIMDKSQIVPIIRALQKAQESGTNAYAIVAPAIATQFKSVTHGQLISAIKALGFTKVVEAALGADMVAYKEGAELAEKGFLTTSCCPTFVSYIKKNFPKVAPNISSNLSPMAEVGKWAKGKDPSCMTVFIGPCVAKKMEIRDERVKPYIDYVMTFEELQAFFDAKEIEGASLPESTLDDASYYGRIFARAGGVSEAAAEALREQGSDFIVKPCAADGIENCRASLLKAQSPVRDFNFLEGMGCVGGCIGGPCNLTHEMRDKSEIDKYGKTSKSQTIEHAIASAEGRE